MLVLAIDTSTPVITAGLVTVKRPHEVAEAMASALTPAPFEVLAEHTVTDAFGHAEHLMPLVDAALAETGHAASDLDAVVVGVGPGPFTGLRVGMVTAAAVGDARGIPVHGVPSHDAMARRVAADGDFLVVTDARRKEAYVSGYRGPTERVWGPQAIRPAELPAALAAEGFTPRWACGAGADLVADALGIPVRAAAVPLSKCLVEAAATPLLTGAIPGPLTPMYLRRPDATEPHAPKPVVP